ncbi:MAG TPA: hypothetical protein VH815_14150, partial [Acidobacteriota bacterium]
MRRLLIILEIGIFVFALGWWSHEFYQHHLEKKKRQNIADSSFLETGPLEISRKFKTKYTF